MAPLSKPAASDFAAPAADGRSFAPFGVALREAPLADFLADFAVLDGGFAAGFRLAAAEAREAGRRSLAVGLTEDDAGAGAAGFAEPRFAAMPLIAGAGLAVFAAARGGFVAVAGLVVALLRAAGLDPTSVDVA